MLRRDLTPGNIADVAHTLADLGTGEEDVEDGKIDAGLRCKKRL